MRKTLLQTLCAAFCAILCGTSALGGGGMIVGARVGAWAGASARSYPLDDSIFQFDGIENVAYGKHDYSLNDFVDLRGNVNFLNMTSRPLEWTKNGLVCSNGIWFESENRIETGNDATIVVCHSNFIGKNAPDAAFVGNFNDEFNNQCFGLWVLDGWKLVGCSYNGSVVGNASYCSMRTYGSRDEIPVGTIIMRGGSGSTEVIVNGDSLGIVHSSSRGRYSHKLRINMSFRTSGQTMNTTYHSIIWFNRKISDSECRKIEMINKARFNLP